MKIDVGHFASVTAPLELSSPLDVQKQGLTEAGQVVVVRALTENPFYPDLELVSGEKGGLGYFGFSYFEQNQDRLKAVEIDGGNGCVAPSPESAQDGSYTPLARPLFVYVKKESLARPEVAAFVQYMLDNNAAIAESALYIPLNETQLADTQAALDAALG